MEVSRRLKEEGTQVPVIQWPTVKRGEARLRIAVRADHELEDLADLVRKMIKCKKLIHYF